MSKKYKVLLKESVQKQLVKLPVIYAKKIRDTILSLEDDPKPFGAIKLKGSNGKFRIRVGVYRIVYEVLDDVLIVYIFDVDHRKDIYR